MERLLQKLHIRPKSPRVDNKIIASPPPIPVEQPSNDNPDLCSTCQDIWPEAISRKRKGWTGSRPIKYEDLKKTAVPAGECYPCYLFVQALGKLELNPNDQITHLDINAERLKGETMSLNAVITGSETREETLEFYCIQGQWRMNICSNSVGNTDTYHRMSHSLPNYPAIDKDITQHRVRQSGYLGERTSECVHDSPQVMRTASKASRDACPRPGSECPLKPVPP
jgi:hypothetical protein